MTSMVSGPVAFVLGGGGVLGAVEVGMLRALFRSGYRPDLGYLRPLGITARFRRRQEPRVVLRSDDVRFDGRVKLRLRVLRARR